MMTGAVPPNAMPGVSPPAAVAQALVRTRMAPKSDAMPTTKAQAAPAVPEKAAPPPAEMVDLHTPQPEKSQCLQVAVLACMS
eukprot:599359-Amphidinium_carterae.1